MNGLHLTADLHDCQNLGAAMTDSGHLRTLCLDAVHAASLTPVAELFHGFPPRDGQVSGVTGVVLLAESHLAVHTWPERAAVTLDVYVCNFGEDNSERAHRLMDQLQRQFQPERVERHALHRGTQ